MRCCVDVSDPVGHFSVPEFDELLFSAEFDRVIDLSVDGLDGTRLSPDEPVGRQLGQFVKVVDVVVHEAWWMVVRVGGGEICE